MTLLREHATREALEARLVRLGAEFQEESCRPLDVEKLRAFAHAALSIADEAERES